MAGIIPQDTIEQVRQANDIVELIGAYVRLKKRGRNYMAVCPFHQEKTASFSVSPDKQIYHCFGCGKGGNVFSFLMEHENMTFVEAVRHLARKAGIVIPEKREDSKGREELERLHYAQQVALDYFKMTLQSKKYRDDIMAYLKGKRKISDESIALFQLGAAGEEWDGLLKYALRKDLFPTDLEKAGLVMRSEKRDSYYDRFRQRLMIPIFNLSDRPIAFGGRALRRGEASKYMNSPETPLYSKSNVLYGLNFSRQQIRDANEVIIVEGYFDYISLYQTGIKNVVASSGTAFTAQQARLLARFADTAFLFFDSDTAGQAAAVRSVDALYDAGLEVMVIVPPKGEDPDSVAVKSGKKGIEELKAAAVRYLEYRTRGIDMKKTGIIAKERLIKEMAELAGRISDPTRRQLFIDEAAERLQTNAHNILTLVPAAATARVPSFEIRPPKKIIDMERELLSIIIRHPEHIDTVAEKIVFEDFQEETLGKIYSLILTLRKNHGAISESALIDMADEKEMASETSSLVQIELHDQNVSGAVKDYIKKILYFKRERMIDRLKGELKMAEEARDNETSERLTREISDLIKRRQE